MKTGRRSYRMTARARSVEATRERILEAAHEAFLTQWYDEVRLGDVAAAAGVTQQTLLNHFGSKQQLFTYVISRRVGPETQRNRFGVEPGEVDAALAVLVAEYDRLGDAGPRFTMMADRSPELAEAYAGARASHRRWNRHVFGPFLDGLPKAERERRLSLLATATDVLTWKLLRRDEGLSRRDTVAAMRRLTGAIIHPEETTP